jgi:hypothetical protein
MLLPAVVMSQSSSTSADPLSAGKDAQAPGVKHAAPPAGSSSQADDSDQDLFTVPPLPKDSKVTLVGGTVRDIDHIKNRVTVNAFGGGKMKFAFDERTHVYKDGVETTQLAIQKGSRVYVDSQLVGPKLFARNIRVVTQLLAADADGQLVSFDQQRGLLAMRDRLSSQPINVGVSNDTKILKRGGQPGSQADLQPGALVAVQFSPQAANRGAAQKITVLAVPGAICHFAGRITHLDMKSREMSIENAGDNKTYDLGFDPAAAADREDLAVGAEVDASAVFKGDRYVAQDIKVTAPAAKEASSDDKKKDRPQDQASDKQ